MFATGLLGEVPVLESFFTGSKPKDLVPDKASYFRAKLQLWDSEAFRSCEGSQIRLSAISSRVQPPAQPGSDACCMEAGKRDASTGKGSRSSPDQLQEGAVEDTVSGEVEKSILGRNMQLLYREVSPQQTTALPVLCILGFSAGSGSH